MPEKPSERFDRQVREETELLLTSPNVRFAAQDLGYPFHTAIHEAACRIIAKHMARQLVPYKYPED